MCYYNYSLGRLIKAKKVSETKICRKYIYFHCFLTSLFITEVGHLVVVVLAVFSENMYTKKQRRIKDGKNEVTLYNMKPFLLFCCLEQNISPIWRGQQRLKYIWTEHFGHQSPSVQILFQDCPFHFVHHFSSDVVHLFTPTKYSAQCS